jgi:hypothetical protein
MPFQPLRAKSGLPPTPPSSAGCLHCLPPFTLHLAHLLAPSATVIPPGPPPTSFHPSRWPIYLACCCPPRRPSSTLAVLTHLSGPHPPRQPHPPCWPHLPCRPHQPYQPCQPPIHLAGLHLPCWSPLTLLALSSPASATSLAYIHLAGPHPLCLHPSTSSAPFIPTAPASRASYRTHLSCLRMPLSAYMLGIAHPSPIHLTCLPSATPHLL